ncbi:MAG: anaerobic ribonucleoside-triphosphate reductase [bacterium]
METTKEPTKNTKRCYDCQEKIIIEGGEVKNGKILVYEGNGEKHIVFKCQSCFDKNPALTDYQKCEVYSRVVGYLRPVQQWNIGKRKEFDERKLFEI